MIFLVVADTQTARAPHIATALNHAPGGEVVVHDDTYGTITDLEQYLYPSLFTTTPPTIHVKFSLEEGADLITTTFLKKLLASPTIFLFEEMALRSPIITLFKKAGAVVTVEEKKKVQKKTDDIFAVTGALTAKDKKTRWMIYRNALEKHSIESIIGILYWKLRDLVAKEGVEKKKYEILYRDMLCAHAKAWQTGAPLELFIEKVILAS